jgi:RHS repeat-associated protein
VATIALLAGSAPASAATGILPPTNSAPPTISGTARDGQSLSSTTGTWSGLGNSYSRQWLRCDAAGNACVNIAAATQPSYVLTSGDVGRTLRVRVSASYALGSDEATSSQTAAVAGNPPVNVVAPTITGGGGVGAQLSAQTGTWSGSTPIGYAFQWMRCDGLGDDCHDIDNATQSTYTVMQADAGNMIGVRVSATNSTAQVSATSAARFIEGAGCTTTFRPASGVWSDAINWSGAAAPSPDDRVCIPAGRRAQLFADSTVTSLHGAGELQLASTLTLTDSAATSEIGTLTFSGVLTGAGDLTVSNALSWSNSATMSGSGRTIVASGATAAISGTGGTLKRTLVNHGSMTVSGSSSRFYGDSSAILDNRGTFTLNNQWGMPPSATGATPTIRNTGVFRKTWTGTSSVEWRVDNDGIVQPGGSGTDAWMIFQGGGVPGDESTGSWALGTYWAAGTYTLGPSTRIVGSALAATDIVATSLNLSNDSELRVFAGTLTLTDADTPSHVGKLLLENAGTVTGAGEIIVDNALTWSGGTMAGSGRTTIPSDATASITSGTLSRTLLNHGSLTGSGTAFFFGDSSAVIDNRGTFTLNLVRSPTTSRGGGLLRASANATPTLRNTGLIKKTSAAENDVEWRVDNDGVIEPGGTITSARTFFSGGGVPGEQSTGSWGAGTFWLSGAHTLGPGARITGDVLMSTDITASSLSSSPDAELHVTQGTLELTNTSTPAQIAKLNLRNVGKIGGPGDLIVDSILTWTNGEMAGSGRTILGPGANGTITAGLLNRTFVNRGELTHAHIGSTGWLKGAPGAVLDNEGVLNLNSETQNPPQVRAVSGSPAATLRNRGIVQKSSGTYETYVDWAYADQGITRELTSGKLRFIGPLIGSGVGSATSAGPPSDELRGGYSDASPGLSTCKRADPISCLTGDFYENLTDIQIAGRGRALDAARSYSAQAAQKEAATTPSGGPARLGPGWTHPYATRLELPTGYVKLHGTNGATALWKANADGTFSAPERVKARLTRGADNAYVVTYKDQTKDVFDSTGRLLRQLDHNAYATSVTYDAGGRIDHVTDEAGRRLTYTHDGAGRISSITDPAGRVVNYDYDPSGDLTSVVDVAGKTWSYGYDSQHRIILMRDPRGHETSNVYDAESRVARQTDPKGGETRFAYTPASTTVTDPRDHQTRYEITGGLISRVIHAVGTAQESTVSMVRNTSGNVTQRTDPDGQVTRVEYDAAGNATKLTDSLDRVTSMTYSPTNAILTVTDPGSVTTTMNYDSTGNLETVSRPLTGTGSTQTTTYAYDPAKPGDLVSLTDPTAKTWTFSNDSDGNRTSTTDPEDHKTTIAYNQLGWPTSTVSPRGNAPGADPNHYRRTTTYNDRGQPTAQTDPLGATVQSAYDAVGNATSITEPGNKTTGTTYDELDRPTTVTRADGSTLRFAYDANGNRTSVKDAAGRETTFTYDALDRKISETDPAGRTTTYGYDRSGRQTTLTDAAARSTTLRYDDASQLQEIDYSAAGTADVDYDYDPLGRRTRMLDGSGTSTYAYDSLHRLTSTTDGSGRQLRYAYDLADRLTKITYPADLVNDTAPAGQTITDPSVTRTHDDAGQITAITDWLGNRTEYDYDPDGINTEQRYPNQTTATMSYDRADRLTQRTDTGPAASTILDLPYARKTNGQLHTQNRPGNPPPQTETLAYDDLDQLTDATTGTGTAAQSYSYTHDIADRLTRINTPDANTTLEYDAANQLVRTRDTNTGHELQTFNFDDVGNRTAQDPAGAAAATTYGYDQASRLTHHQAPAPDPADPDIERDYAYDGDGLRADLLWDSTGDLPLIVGDSAGLYVTGPDGLALTGLTFDGEQRYYHHDQLGSTRAITNAAGTVTARYTFDPYGNPVAGSSAADSRFGYAGQHTDRASGLIYMRARWYDPATGQFITADPIGLASGETNLYRYAGGDPANHVDPSGLLDLGIVDIGLPSGADVSNFFAGFGDTATFGITKQIRGALGIDYVDYCSSAYGYGGTAATIAQVGSGVVGAAKLAGKIGVRQLGRRLADETGSISVSGLGHNLKYHPRIRARGVQDPRAHNFPYTFDSVILKQKPVTQEDGSLIYRMAGSVNGGDGVYEIAVNPTTGTIFHRTWRSR